MNNADQKRAETLVAKLTGQTLEGSPRITGTVLAGCKRGKSPHPAEKGQAEEQPPQGPFVIIVQGQECEQ